MSDEQKFVTEVPSSLKQLARLVVRSFYSVDDALIIDMLVRNPCMKEDDMCELLKFERKMLRSRIAGLKNDKFLQIRLRMETGPDGKAQKVNYYFINYKSFVNVVKYKLDMMRKKMEMVERDATNRASFLCRKCGKTFTDLEADQLFDCETGEFRCTFCYDLVEEDSSSLPKQDSRLMVAKFNSQLEPLYKLLSEVEGIRLAPELLEPEPVDISTILGLNKKSGALGSGDIWSGEATRHRASEEAQIDVTVGDDIADSSNAVVKERPVWLVESTVVDRELAQASMMLEESDKQTQQSDNFNNIVATSTAKSSEDIMSVLLQHEKRGTNRSNIAAAAAASIRPPAEDSGSDSSEEPDKMGIPDFNPVSEVGEIESDDDDEIPSVLVGIKRIPVTEIDDSIIKQMTQEEKDHYIQVYQEYYASLYE